MGQVSYNKIASKSLYQRTSSFAVVPFLALSPHISLVRALNHESELTSIPKSMAQICRGVAFNVVISISSGQPDFFDFLRGVPLKAVRPATNNNVAPQKIYKSRSFIQNTRDRQYLTIIFMFQTDRLNRLQPVLHDWAVRALRTVTRGSLV